MKYIILPLVFILFAGCFKSKESSSLMADSDKKSVIEDAVSNNEASAEHNANGDYSTKEASAVLKQVIIKTGKITIRTEAFKESEIHLKRIIARHQILVQNQKQENDNYTRNGNYTLRVSVELFDKMMDTLKQIGVECTQNESKSDDLTSEYVDTEIRLKTKLTVYEQYMLLIKQAKSVDEVLKVQESARVLQEEIESMEGRLKFLSGNAQYSTINLSLFENIKYVSKADGLWIKMKNQFKQGIDIMQGIILMLITIWPLLLIATTLIVMRRKIRRILNRKWNPKIS